MRTILVTGASGFAGSHLVDRLLANNRVVGWTRGGRRAAAARPGLTWQQVDLLDKGAVARALHETKPDAVCHVAGAPRIDTASIDVVPHLTANVMGTHNVLEAVRSHSPSCRVLVVSSAMVYDTASQPITEETDLRPSSPYGRSKLAQDLLALRAATDDGMDVVVARPFNHIGPRQEPHFAIASFARQVALIEAGQAEPVIRVGNLDAERDIADVRDVADAYERLIGSGASGRAYNVCASQAVRIGDALDQLVSLSGTPVRIAVDPERLRPSDTPLIVGNATRLRSELNWTPRFSFQQTLRDILDWWREQVRAGFA